VYWAGTIHDVDVEVVYNQSPYIYTSPAGERGEHFDGHPLRFYLVRGQKPQGVNYFEWNRILDEHRNPYYKKWSVVTRDGQTVVAGAKTPRKAIVDAARKMELGSFRSR